MDTAGWIEQPHFSLANADHNGVVSWEFIKKKKKKGRGLIHWGKHSTQAECSLRLLPFGDRIQKFKPEFVL